MKKLFSPIVYIIIILLVLACLLLLIFKDAAIDPLRRRAGVDSAAAIAKITATTVTVASSSTLDISILKLPRFTALANQVANFNFDNICWRPDAVTSQPAGVNPSGSEATSTEKTASVNCVQGNSLPFGAKKK